MSRTSILPLAPAILLGMLALPSTSVSGAIDGQLVWADEFDGTSVDPSIWTFEVGDGCPNLCNWGNDELQYYRAENASVAGGLLTIEAREESFDGYDYTSARMHTRAIGGWRYGRIEMRAKLPAGRGLWPAFWMMPTDDVYGTWAASGEIDILEMRGQEPNRIIGVIHYGGEWPQNVSAEGPYILPSGSFDEDFHEFALEWEEGVLRWYVDGHLFFTRTTWFSTGGPFPAPFDQRFYLILNVAVGGTFPGPPDESTEFPAQMVVDWVRVYQDLDTTAVSAAPSPSGLLLHAATPNPFRAGTEWSFELPRASNVEVTIYDVRGRIVRQIESDAFSAGRHTAHWDGLDESGRRAASGVYECVLTTPHARRVRSVNLLR